MSDLTAVSTAIWNRFDRVTLDAGPAVDVGGGVVGIPSTGHGFASGEVVVFSGTTNYDDTYTVLASTTANQINITETFTAETFTTSDYAEHQFYNSIGGRLREVKAKQQETFPFCVFWMVTDTNDLNFSDQNVTLQYQFDILTRGNNARPAGLIQGYLNNLFGDCTLTISGWRHLSMTRDFTIPIHDLIEVPAVMGFSTQFIIEIERLKP